MEKSKKISINLSSRRKVSVTNAFYKWAFEAGRAIVVVIELVALGALGYRFLVDGTIVDLHDEINRQEFIVEARAEEEVTYRGIQERLRTISIISGETEGKVQVMNTILTSINEGIFTDTNLSVNQQTITLSGTALSIFSVESFINSIQGFEQIESISVDEINAASSGIKFRLRVRLHESDLES